MDLHKLRKSKSFWLCSALSYTKPYFLWYILSHNCANVTWIILCYTVYWLSITYPIQAPIQGLYILPVSAETTSPNIALQAENTGEIIMLQM